MGKSRLAPELDEAKICGENCQILSRKEKAKRCIKATFASIRGNRTLSRADFIAKAGYLLSEFETFFVLQAEKRKRTAAYCCHSQVTVGYFLKVEFLLHKTRWRSYADTSFY